MLFNVGENTQERRYFVYSRSPLCFDFCWSFVFQFVHVGEITQVNILYTLVLPTVICHYHDFDHFGVAHLGPHGYRYRMVGQGHDPYTMYIYSLRHFLTTKGALIDGDGYPPKNPKNDPKKGWKMTKNWSKFMSKKCQNQWFLMAKSSFWPKSTIID